MSEFLDLAGLTRYDTAIKARAGAKLTISGRTIKLVAMNGTAELASIDVPETSVPKATAQADGLFSKEDFAKLQGIADGAQVNVIERVSVNGAQLPITSKGVNVDLSAYALKNDIVGVYRFKGSVAFAQLPAISGEGVTPPKAGDVYNVTDAFSLDGKNYPAGTNVAFVAASGNVVAHWDALGGESVTVTAISNSQIDALFS